jgi:hypothetical protein
MPLLAGRALGRLTALGRVLGGRGRRAVVLVRSGKAFPFRRRSRWAVGAREAGVDGREATRIDSSEPRRRLGRAGSGRIRHRSVSFGVLGATIHRLLQRVCRVPCRGIGACGGGHVRPLHRARSRAGCQGTAVLEFKLLMNPGFRNAKILLVRAQPLGI